MDVLSAQNASRKDAADYITEDDLWCGQMIHIFGKDYKLVSCDEFTKQYVHGAFKCVTQA